MQHSLSRNVPAISSRVPLLRRVALVLWVLGLASLLCVLPGGASPINRISAATPTVTARSVEQQQAQSVIDNLTILFTWYKAHPNAAFVAPHNWGFFQYETLGVNDYVSEYNEPLVFGTVDGAGAPYVLNGGAVDVGTGEAGNDNAVFMLFPVNQNAHGHEIKVWALAVIGLGPQFTDLQQMHYGDNVMEIGLQSSFMSQHIPGAHPGTPWTKTQLKRVNAQVNEVLNGDDNIGAYGNMIPRPKVARPVGEFLQSYQIHNSDYREIIFAQDIERGQYDSSNTILLANPIDPNSITQAVSTLLARFTAHPSQMIRYDSILLADQNDPRPLTS